MDRTLSPGPKVAILRRDGALNRHPERVGDALFAEAFFDPRDLVQIKYEMLRRVQVDGASITAVCAAFGFTRPVFYKAQAAFARQGLLGLVPQKRGPRGGHKLTGEIIAWLKAGLAADPSLRARDLAQRVRERYGFSVHPRSVRRAMVRRGKKHRWASR